MFIRNVSADLIEIMFLAKYLKNNHNVDRITTNELMSDVSVLASSPNKRELIFLETIYIKTLNPPLNAKLKGATKFYKNLTLNGVRSRRSFPTDLNYALLALNYFNLDLFKYRLLIFSYFPFYHFYLRPFV